MVIIVGFYLLLYPWISNWLFQNRARSLVTAYQNKIDNTSKQDLEEMLQKAKKYNDSLFRTQVSLTDPFMEPEGKDNAELEYDSLLNFDDSGLMGYLEIPVISVNLPIFHGTDAYILENGVGHLEGSSLPVGGKDTHAVLTGHTGLTKAKLFTDLVELEQKDFFFIHIAGRTFTYEVTAINVIIPEDISRLSVFPGKDLVTLVTCTPYGVNTHRLLVTGQRVDDTKNRDIQAISDGNDNDSMWMRIYRRAILMGVFLAILFLFLISFLQKKKGARDKRV